MRMVRSSSKSRVRSTKGVRAAEGVAVVRVVMPVVAQSVQAVAVIPVPVVPQGVEAVEVVLVVQVVQVKGVVEVLEVVHQGQEVQVMGVVDAMDPDAVVLMARRAGRAKEEKARSVIQTTTMIKIVLSAAKTKVVSQLKMKTRRGRVSEEAKEQ